MDRAQIEQFVHQILEEAGLDDIPDSFKIDYVKNLGYELQRRLSIIAINSLDNRSYLDFSKFISRNPDQDFISVCAFFKERIPHFHALMIRGMQEFKAEIFERMKNLRTIKHEVPRFRETEAVEV
ncbi:hypothetical protein JXJ21_02905 [candidate division KSB1 bacterium]|nr:hypothetical protein [candidate division KSB1 bacterium]